VGLTPVEGNGVMARRIELKDENHSAPGKVNT
jgi:hypothetical protein